MLWTKLRGHGDFDHGIIIIIILKYLGLAQVKNYKIL